jgi:hypothetical protein
VSRAAWSRAAPLCFSANELHTLSLKVSEGVWDGIKSGIGNLERREIDRQTRAEKQIYQLQMALDAFSRMLRQGMPTGDRDARNQAAASIRLGRLRAHVIHPKASELHPPKCAGLSIPAPAACYPI